MTPALLLHSGLPHKTSQTLLAHLFAHKGFKNIQTRALQSNVFSLNSSFQKEWLQLGGIGLECLGSSTGSRQAGVERQRKRARGKGKQDVQGFPKVLQTRPGIFNTRKLRATSQFPRDSSLNWGPCTNTDSQSPTLLQGWRSRPVFSMTVTWRSRTVLSMTVTLTRVRKSF